MRTLAYAIIAFVVLQRLAELGYAARNTRALLKRGGVEVGRAHYPLIVILHAAWLAAIVLFLPKPVHVNVFLLAAFVVLQALRLWILATLGRYWTTRIITLKDAPLVSRGPYRFLRHPNYAVVAGEIAILPLMFGEGMVAVVFSVLNAAVLALRIRQEDRALSPRRAASAGRDAGAAPTKG